MRLLGQICRQGAALGLAALLLSLGLAVSSCSKDAKKKKVVNPRSPTAEELLEAVDPNPEPAALAEELTPDPAPDPGVDESSTVSILGYHDFTLTREPSEMRIREDKFRKQMQMLKDGRIQVVSLDDYLSWRRGEVNLPKRCVVITADDGWRKVHTYAMPILKEFGYPFTIFLYTKFLDSGGRTLTQSQVEELIAAGATIGSHSISHRDMNQIKVGNLSMSFGKFDRLRTAYSKGLEALDGGASVADVDGVQRSREAVEAKLKEYAEALETYDAWILDELKTSKELLERKFSVPVKTFAYPYGPYNERIIKMAMDVGYEAMITVNGAKANFESPLGEIPRFIIHGGDDRNWKMATSFGGAGGLDAEGDLLNPGEDEEGRPKPTLVRLTPAKGELIGDRQPLIEFDFSRLEGVEVSSLEMRVGGFGVVPAMLDAENKTLSWKVRRKLRNDICNVQVTLRQGGKMRRVAWEFSIDKLALYQPTYLEKYGSGPVEGEIPRAVPVN